MQTSTSLLIAVALTMFYSEGVVAIEKPEYRVVETVADVEIREYPAMTVARTRVEGSFKTVGNTAFRRLAGYIFGGNNSGQKIAMTAPVSQFPDKTGDGYWITFMMPSGLKLTELPAPDDQNVELLALPAQAFAAIAYRGGWNEKAYRKHEKALRDQLALMAAWTATGEPVWARYDPPMMPAWFRRNEVLIPITRK